MNRTYKYKLSSRLGRGASTMLLPGVAFSLGVVFAPEADALSQYPGKIPNGSVNSCGTCHVNPGGGGTRNAFGVAVAQHKSGVGFSADIRWSELWFLDSDGDGQTNGQELGDPCGEWESGAMPARTTDISAPGDEDDTSANPGEACEPEGNETPDAGVGTGNDAGQPGDNDGGDDDGDDGDSAEPAGGCSATESRTNARPFGLFALLGLGYFVRRRR